MFKEIKKFMGAVGLLSGKPSSKEEILAKLKARQPFAEEEHKEFYEDGVDGKDLKECMDALVDRFYFLAQDWIELEEAGFDVQGALKEIHINNALKYSKSLETVKSWLEELKEVTGKDDWYIASTVYEGDNYHCLKHKETHKVSKRHNFPKVRLDVYVPEEFR